ncbi:SPFH domain-containing protein [Streptomyces sp. NPDC004539]|uniref:SPFH domain-containing protein n=1 Tax=Streptomyces sp. NPDC004539 TaxID=3154280 RepID=UPI0033B690D1
MSSTTTSQTAGSGGPAEERPDGEPRGTGAAPGGGPAIGLGPGKDTKDAPRPARLIQNEATTEIPVHLLFRDDPEPGPLLPVDPAAIGRPQTGGIGAPGLPLGSSGYPRSTQGPPPTPRLRRPGRHTPRPAAQVDPALVERPARVLPGTVGVLAGTCGAAGCVATSWWAGVLPHLATEALHLPVYGGTGLGLVQWAAYAGSGALGLFGFGGLARGRTGRAWVLGLFGRYRGTVRRTGLLWVNPLLLRRRVDVRLRHWRSEPMPAADGSGVALRAVVLVVWRVRDTARATLGVEDHETYLRECVEAALARVPVEMPGAGRGPVETAGDALTRLVAADAGAIGLEVYSVQPVRVEYAPEVAAAMHRRRIAALDAQHRATVLTSVVDSVEDTVTRLTMRGLVELDDYERKALVKDLTVAFCAGRGEGGA